MIDLKLHLEFLNDKKAQRLIADIGGDPQLVPLKIDVYREVIHALEEAKKLINDIDANNTIKMDDYGKWTQKYFGEE